MVESGVNSTITGGNYQFKFSDDAYSALVLVPLGLSSEYTLETYVRSTTTAGEYGLVFNLTSWSEYHHLIIIDPDKGTYEIVRRKQLSGQNPEFINVKSGSSSAIDNSGENKITITISGNRITTLKINESIDLLTSDISIPSSEIYADHWAALYAGTWDGENNVTIQFNKISFTANVSASSNLYLKPMGSYGQKSFEKISTGSSLRSR